jgi:hypothetical protein
LRFRRLSVALSTLGAKWARRGSAAEFGLLVAASTAGACGYHPVYGAGPTERLHVMLVRARVPDPVASEEVASGMREGLAQAGSLAPGDGFPRAEIEVLKTDESSEAMTVGTTGPMARATDVGILARAWVVSNAGGQRERDTGDIRADEVIAVDRIQGVLDPRGSAFHEADALRAAARRLGLKLASKLLGDAAASEEPVRMP